MRTSTYQKLKKNNPEILREINKKIYKRFKESGKSREIWRAKYKRLRASDRWKKVLEAKRIRYKQKRRELKNLIVQYKGGKCQICGYNKCLDALDFHHTDRAKKENAISLLLSKLKRLDVIKREADSCVLICANCHREIHRKL